MNLLKWLFGIPQKKSIVHPVLGRTSAPKNYPPAPYRRIQKYENAQREEEKLRPDSHESDLLGFVVAQSIIDNSSPSNDSCSSGFDNGFGGGDYSGSGSGGNWSGSSDSSSSFDSGSSDCGSSFGD